MSKCYDSSSTVSVADSVKKEKSQIQQEFIGLEDAIQRAEKIWGEFKERLEPVLFGKPSEPVDDEAQARPTLCELADRIRNVAERIRLVADRIDEANSELEL